MSAPTVDDRRLLAAARAELDALERREPVLIDVVRALEARLAEDEDGAE